MDRGAWWATVNGVTKSQTQLRTEHAQAPLRTEYLPSSSEATYCRKKRLKFLVMLLVKLLQL